MSNYSEVNCPKCNCPNLLYLGDLDDLTKPDIEAVICWNCKHKWLLDGAAEWTSIDEANTITGEIRLLIPPEGESLY